jgi:magnesium transporter
MAHAEVKAKGITWYHFPELEEEDFLFLEKEFKFHPLDFDDLRDSQQLPKLDTYKYYLFCIFAIPKFDRKQMRMLKTNLSIFIGKDYIVTAAQTPIDSVNRFFIRASRSSGLKRDLFSKSTGYVLYKLLDYAFRDTKVILKELVREANEVEEAVYDDHTKVTTKRLGIVRRNVLYMRHVIDPQRILLGQIIHAKKSFVPKTLEDYFDDVKDTLDGMWVVTENLKNIVDGLFDVNEAFLSHKMNDIIRILTIISVILMPATLLTGYFGMNIEGLPLTESPIAVTVTIITSILLLLLVIMRIDRE